MDAILAVTGGHACSVTSVSCLEKYVSECDENGDTAICGFEQIAGMGNLVENKEHSQSSKNMRKCVS
jgi:hypothetical protein